MKLTLATIALFLSATSLLGQNYSTFYGTYDVNANINVNKNVNVSGTVNQNINKTVTTIDYGALAAANAQKEANRLNSMMFADEREARIAEAIAVDPFAAFTYGKDFYEKYSRSKSLKMNRGFKNKIYWYHRIPHSLLFNYVQFGSLRNMSESGVLCEIHLEGVRSVQNWREQKGFTALPDSLLNPRALAEEQVALTPVGEVKNDNFYHKVTIGRATVYSHSGYRVTNIFEGKYQYVIEDYYYSRNTNKSINYMCLIKYSIDKDRGSFEELEGRRHYLRRVSEEIIATAKCDIY